ncbi:MAG: hypothetical protein KC621_12855 [Myxococcales bacterium]|nr:hypothetical protein [Myxococcales bacterium]
MLVVYCPGGDVRPYSAPDKPKPPYRQVPWIRVGPQTVEAQADFQRQLVELVARIPFDDRRSSATVEDLSPRLVERHLREVGSARSRDARPYGGCSSPGTWWRSTAW